MDPTSNDNQRKRNRPNHLAQYVVNTDELCDDENEPKKRRVDHRVRHQRPDPRTGHQRPDPRTGHQRPDPRTGYQRPDLRTGHQRPDPRTGHQRIKNVKVQQQWDTANPCGVCGAIFLMSEQRQFRDKCCLSGKIYNAPWPQLEPLPEEIKNILRNESNHMSSLSAYYNKMLSVVCVGAMNNKENRQMYQSFHGMPHTIRLQGSTYDYLPTVNKSFKGVKRTQYVIYSINITLNRWIKLFHLRRGFRRFATRS